MCKETWNTWTIEAYQKGEPKPIIIGSCLEKELDFWLDMNRQSDARAMRRTGAKKGPRYHLKAYYHVAGQDHKIGKLTEFKFSEEKQNWV